ncbi:hypothetical protein S40293_08897 [Stachybotrys chartarum IBT 40293]|nr:hypothetical protein S40293_08897 [Stachybotrys chartarum IBT 40293]
MQPRTSELHIFLDGYQRLPGAYPIWAWNLTSVSSPLCWPLAPLPRRLRPTSDRESVSQHLWDLDSRSKESIAIYSDITDDGNFAYFSIALSNHVAALDISDLNNVKRPDDPNENPPIIGPHYFKISPDKKNLLVTGYFFHAGDINAQNSVLNTPGDYKGHWIDILEDGSLSFN